MARQVNSEEAINGKLKAAGIRLRVVARNRKLSLRGTLPPRPGESKPKQTYLALGLETTPYGYRMAEMKAHEVWSQLGQESLAGTVGLIRLIGKLAKHRLIATSATGSSVREKGKTVNANGIGVSGFWDYGGCHQRRI